MTDVLTERSGNALWITLNRPERYNAFDGPMAQTIIDALRQAGDATAVVITGAGEGFCAGGYVANLAAADPADVRALLVGTMHLLEEIRLTPQPVIAAVNGPAVGGGNELVVACDFAIAADTAYFGQNGPRVGSAPVLGGANMLAMSIGEKQAKEVAMLCRRYPAVDALARGWINEVVPPAGLEAAVERWVDELHQLSPRYLEITKASSNAWWNGLRDTYAQGVGALIQAIGSDDMIEGANAFMEKRPARFRD